MKLFLVIYVGALVAGSIGPLPYEDAECQRHAARPDIEVAP